MGSVVLVGLGAIGRGVGRALAARGYDILGGVDSDRTIAGQSLAAILEPNPPSGSDLERRQVFPSASDFFSRAQPDVAVVCTSSRAEEVLPEIQTCLENQTSVVTTCEGLASASAADGGIGSSLDSLARRRACSVVATGVNPGFVMDALPLVLTAPCLEIRWIRVTRVLDAKARRDAFQKKAGVGLSLDEFARAAQGLGHLGLEDSARVVADYLGWPLADVRQDLRPIAEGGVVRGVRQTLVASAEDGRGIELTFEARADASDARDEIEIIGVPSFTAVIPGGIPGDEATVAMVVNTIPRLLSAGPGLFRMPDLPLRHSAVRMSGR